jgi:hypothetical protein
MDDPKELERLKNYKPSIDDLRMRSPIILQKETTSFVQDTLYAFLYNPMIHESGYITVSIHRTREGAEKALEWHKKEELRKFNEEMDELRKEMREKANPEEYIEIYIATFKFNPDRCWKIEEIKILD